jgi:hypothetical protein
MNYLLSEDLWHHPQQNFKMPLATNPQITTLYTSSYSLEGALLFFHNFLGKKDVSDSQSLPI